MSARFVAASSQRLICATHPLTAYPVTVGMWVNITSLPATATFFSIIDTGVANSYLRLGSSTGNKFEMTAAAAGAADNTQSSGLMAADTWHFMLARFITATNRTTAVLGATAFTETISDTTSRAFPASAETISLGSRIACGVLVHEHGHPAGCRGHQRKFAQTACLRRAVFSPARRRECS